MDRRRFLGSIAVPAVAVPLACHSVLKHDSSARLRELGSDERPAEEVARDEDYWFQVQEAFTVDRAMLNLNNGGVCPAPVSVQNAMKRYYDQANESPAYVLFRVQDPQKEVVRSGLARLFGADPEEIAITRNASESLENVQQGLELQRGDEILTSNQDYPRMLTTWKQRERREGLVLKEISLPVACTDPAEIVRRYEAAITPRTRVIHMCHVINLTGQILPVKQVVQMARPKGIPVIVDGAHSFAHIDFKHADLDCDFFGTSLHKFLFAPHGTGMLFVRREKIPSVWPLMAAPETLDADIRKFEEIGTHPLGNYLAITDALVFHLGIGPKRKEQRMLYLRDRWAKRLMQHPRVRLNTSLEPGFATGVCNVDIEGVDPLKLADHLWNKHRIFTVAILHAEFQGIRVSPAVYTTLGELDRFSSAMEAVLKTGIPG